MEKNYNNPEYSITQPGVPTNQLDHNEVNKQMYDYYYNNPNGMINNKGGGYNNILNERNFNGNKNVEAYYYNNYNTSAYVNNYNKNNNNFNNYNNSYNNSYNSYNSVYNSINNNINNNMSNNINNMNNNNNSINSNSINMNNKNNIIYDESGSYVMNNYTYMMDQSYCHVNNTMHPLSNTLDPFNNSLNRYHNNIDENCPNFHFNNLDPNLKPAGKYKMAGNITSNSSFHSSITNYNSEDKKNILEMTNTTTYNVNTLLRNNILSSEYFRSLITLKTFKEVVDEIHSYADHVEPYCIGSNRAPSTLFCCLYKLFTMHLSEKQLKGLIDHKDSCYIRACGFLYLRYVHSPANLWMWFEPYLLDEEEFIISADKRKKLTMGEYIQNLLSDDKYFSTVLPRLPIKIKNIYGARLMIISDHRRRLKKNKEKITKFVKGEPVMAYVNGEWEKGEIGGIVYHGKDKTFVRVRKIDGNEKLVNIGFVKLGSKESDKDRDLDRHVGSESKNDKNDRNDKSHRRRRSRSGRRSRDRSMDRSRDRSRDQSRDRNKHRDKHRSRHRSRDRSRDRRRKRRTGEERNNSSYNKSHGDNHGDRPENKHSKRSHERSNKKRDRSISRSNSEKRTHRKHKYENTEDELISKFRKIESQKALATGKDYARRPTSYKSSLTLKVDNICTRKKSRSRSPKRIDRVVHLPQNDSKNKENVTTENAKLKELMQKYNRDDADDENDDDNNSNNNNKNDGKNKINAKDLEEFDVMTLG
ncbi:pre-mRNA-splicing factor 38B, putative [Plasmodium malariae]|uniref:Pre-mRNA-splicing factor 38B, putative n=1 Tax=Plasmodium malariae TaxID=5858 RepID=A0A1C3KFX7_PLAMA|nr:pre-mRNA-splicing factor 38B, putative [Plasmodium malariae]